MNNNYSGEVYWGKDTARAHSLTLATEEEDWFGRLETISARIAAAESDFLMNAFFMKLLPSVTMRS